MSGHILNHLLTDETKRAHRARWFVYAGRERIPYQATMRGTWGYDVECSCGWASKTGGATRGSVEDALFDHRYEAQAAAETDAGMRAEGLDPSNTTERIRYLRTKLAEEV